MYHFNLVPRMRLAESLTLFHQAPNIAQIRDSEIHDVMLKINIQIKKGCKDLFKIRVFIVHIQQFQFDAFLKKCMGF